MQRRFATLGLLLASMTLAVLAHAAEQEVFDPKEVAAATTRLIAALENPDPTAWVYMYTEDAGLLEAGSTPLQGRAQLMELARSMQPMSSVVITPSRCVFSSTPCNRVSAISGIRIRQKCRIS